MHTDINNSMIDEILYVIDGIREDYVDQAQEKSAPGKKEKLVSAIREKIFQEARKENFKLAEKYRIKLVEIAPNLLKDLYETGRIIAEEKNKALNKIKKTVTKPPPVQTGLPKKSTAPPPSAIQSHWTNLENIFTEEEHAALLSILSPLSVNQLTHLVKPNQINDRLFLIHQGCVQIYSAANGRKSVLKKLEAGSICGVDTFLTGNPSKTFIQIIKGSRVDYVEKAQLDDLTATYPDIENRLIHYINDCANDIDHSQQYDLDSQANKNSEASETIDVKENKKAKAPKKSGKKETAQSHWTNLENIFTEEEYAAMLSILSPLSVNQLTHLVKPNQMNDRLFLIHQGRVQIYSGSNGRKSVLKKLEAGSICGVETFLTGNPSKTFVQIIKGSRVDYVEKAQLKDLTATYPDIENRLLNYIYDCANDIDHSQQYDLDSQTNKNSEASETIDVKENKRAEAPKKVGGKETAASFSRVIKNQWSFLNKYLTQKEHAVFLDLLKPVAFQTATSLLERGRMNDRLFFIQHGFVDIYIKSNGKRISLQKMGPGSVCGVDSFMSGNVSNAFIEASSGTVIDCFEKAKLNTWLAADPTIQNRLAHCICESDNDIDYSRLNVMDRRYHKRFEASGNIGAQIIESPGKEFENLISGTLIDISQNGLAFQIKTSHANPGALKGKKANVAMELEQMSPSSQLFWGGAIVGVNALNKHQYSVHLKGEKNSGSVTALIEQFYVAEKYNAKKKWHNVVNN